MTKKIKHLPIWKSPKCILLFVVEAILIIVGIFSLFGKNHQYEYDLDDITMNAGIYDKENQSYVAKASQGEIGNVFDFEHINLPKGHYIVSLEYTTDVDYSNYCSVTAPESSKRYCLTNGSNLHKALNKTDYEMWILRDISDIIVHASCSEGVLTVKGLSIQETNALYRIYLFICYHLLYLGD